MRHRDQMPVVVRKFDLTQFPAERALKTCRGAIATQGPAIPLLLKSERSVGKEEWNDQADCCCRLRLVNRNIGSSHDACTDLSAQEQYVDANRRRLWSGQDPGQRRMRGQNNRPSNPQGRSQVCPMAGWSLRIVPVKAATGVRSITTGCQCFPGLLIFARALRRGQTVRFRTPAPKERT